MTLGATLRWRALSRSFGTADYGSAVRDDESRPVGSVRTGGRSARVRSGVLAAVLAEVLDYGYSGMRVERIARAALALLQDSERRKSVQLQLRSVVDSLGGAGASQRAATAILGLISF